MFPNSGSTQFFLDIIVSPLHALEHAQLEHISLENYKGTMEKLYMLEKCADIYTVYFYRAYALYNYSIIFVLLTQINMPSKNVYDIHRSRRWWFCSTKVY